MDLHRQLWLVLSSSCSYFTAGLGGSGAVNLLITNEGFGVEMPVFRDGKLSPEMTSGRHPRRVQFYLDETDASLRRVGDRVVWNWPFPGETNISEEFSLSLILSLALCRVSLPANQLHVKRRSVHGSRARRYLRQ